MKLRKREDLYLYSIPYNVYYRELRIFNAGAVLDANHKLMPVLDDHTQIIDTWQHLKTLKDFPDYADRDIEHAAGFLKAYRGSQATMNTYRSSLERLIQWSWFVAGVSITELRRNHIEAHIEFLQDPPDFWISSAIYPRFSNRDGLRVPNPRWRPCVVKVPKHEKNNPAAIRKKYKLSNESIKTMLGALGTFFKYLIDDGITEVNPVASIGQKSRFIKNGSDTRESIKRITNLQVDCIEACCEELAKTDPDTYLRSKLIFQLLLSMYLRKSDLLPTRANEDAPKMKDFERDGDGYWWFHVTGKGNKNRSIPVSSQVLDALKQYRAHLGLSPLPSKFDDSPLIQNISGQAIADPKSLWLVIQDLIDQTIVHMKKEGFDEVDYHELLTASPHWLRHTGISEDVNRRPKDHVREDAGHSSFKTTERYINAEKRERHESARNRDAS